MKLIKIIGFAPFIVLCSHLHAQEGEFHIGFQTTQNISWLSTNQRGVTNVGSNHAPGIAIRGEFGLSDGMSLTTGFGISFNRGGTLRHEIGGNLLPDSRLSNSNYNSGQKPLPDGTRLRYSIQYAELPVGLKWHVTEKEQFKYFIEAPILTWGFSLHRRGSLNAGEIQAEKEDISKDVSPLNLTFGLGAGMEYALGSKTILVGGLYFHRGILDITSNKATRATHNPDDNPFDPNDDYISQRENSRALLNMIGLRLGVLF